MISSRVRMWGSGSSRLIEGGGDEHPRIAARILLLTGSIYHVEKRLREKNAGPLDRQRVRWLESRKPHNHLTQLIRRLSRFRRITPRSKLGNALAYAANPWPHLEPCFVDGQIELDNNLIENAIRPSKLGHKNWMFVRSEHTRWRSAVIYTFVEQVRRHGADPFAYFEWVFENLMHDPASEELQALQPANWIKTRPATSQTIESRVA